MRILGRFLADRAGNFGILTAFLMVPIVGAAGMAIDFGQALSLRSDLMGIADAAALGAISEGSAGYKAITTMTQDGEVTLGQKDGKALFLAQRATVSGINLSDLPLDVSMTVTRLNGQITSTATFSADVPTTFMSLLGKTSVTISGSATAAYGGQSKSFTDFYMLLDNTPSMGIAATTKEMQRMKNLTGANGGRACAFACHLGWYDGDGKFNEDQNSTYIVARANKVKLRVDVVADAAAALIDKIKSQMSTTVSQYRVAAYSFGKYALEPGYRIDRISALTVDMNSASKATESMALMTTDHDWFNDNALTSFDTSLTAIGKEILGNGGTGASAADPEKIVYFVTDGMQDSLKPGGTCGGSWEGSKGRCHEPIDVKYCQALKDRKIKIAVLYTTYIPLDGDGTWDSYIKNVFANKIGPSLKQCASPGLFFEVGPDEDMEAAMVKLFVQASSGTSALRLTN
jgi:Flp pilus assembly protein TadG